MLFNYDSPNRGYGSYTPKRLRNQKVFVSITNKIQFNVAAQQFYYILDLPADPDLGFYSVIPNSGDNSDFSVDAAGD
ncbi:hypothetical protein D1872_293650 [compost metagenome]